VWRRWGAGSWGFLSAGCVVGFAAVVAAGLASFAVGFGAGWFAGFGPVAFGFVGGVCDEAGRAGDFLFAGVAVVAGVGAAC